MLLLKHKRIMFLRLIMMMMGKLSNLSPLKMEKVSTTEAPPLLKITPTEDQLELEELQVI